MMMPAVSRRNRSRTSVSGYEAAVRKSTNNTRSWVLVLMVLACLCTATPMVVVDAFTSVTQQHTSREMRRHEAFTTRKQQQANTEVVYMALYATASSSNNKIIDDETNRLRARALEVLKKSKAKLAALEEQRLAAATASSTTTSSTSTSAGQATIPFFASATKVVRPLSSSSSSSSNISSSSDKNKRDAVTKSRNATTGLITTDGEKMAALSEKEEWESRPLMQVFQNENGSSSSSSTSRQLAERDVAASIFNLRQKLHSADYQRIFDKRNRFIGEDN